MIENIPNDVKYRQVMNVLVSSTRQWNPGDEFILMGVRNLIEEVLEGKVINWVLYDRNPDLFVDGFDNPLHKEKIWGNSFHGHDPKSLDVAVITGTPEWFGPPLKGLYKAVREADLPLLVLGVGYVDAPITFTEDEIYCLKNLARIITVRDEYASRAFNEIGIQHNVLPCPALFASMKEDIPNEIKRIGFIIQTNKTVNQSVPEEISHACAYTVKRLREKGFTVDVICHYIDEFIEFARTLAPIRYSYEARDYINILKDYDLIISTRLHGAILANSLGKPAVLLYDDDSRIKGASTLFHYIYISKPDTLLDNLNKIDLSKMNELIEWKGQLKRRYLEILNKGIEF